MQKNAIIFLLFMSCMACNADKKEKPDTTSEPATEMKFDKDLWRIKEGESYPHREKMVNDVLYSESIRSLNKFQILELLGDPDRSSEGHLFYTVAQTRIGLWPLKTKTLVFKFSEDNSIEWIKTHG